MAETRMSLKLLIDKRKQRVLFAEGGKDFVDFLFTILSLPIGAVMKLLKSAMGNSLIKLYGSLEDLDTFYMKRSPMKYTLLCTKPIYDKRRVIGLFPCSGFCGGNIKGFSSSGDCEYCENCLTRIRLYVASAAGAVKVDGTAILEGYVEDKVTYVIMDDLVVKPMSAVTLFNQLNMREIGPVEEKVVYVDMKEALDLLVASLQSTTVLTDVFLAQEKDN